MISIAFVVLCRVGCHGGTGVVPGHVDFTLLEDKTDCDSFKSEIRKYFMSILSRGITSTLILSQRYRV